MAFRYETRRRIDLPRWIANVGRRDARTRIAHLLCEVALRLEVAGLGSRSDYVCR